MARTGPVFRRRRPSLRAIQTCAIACAVLLWLLPCVVAVGQAEFRSFRGGEAWAIAWDRSSPDLDLVLGHAGGQVDHGGETQAVAEIVTAYRQQGMDVVGALNASFFDLQGTGAPIGILASDGEVHHLDPDPTCDVFALDTAGRFHAVRLVGTQAPASIPDWRSATVAGRPGQVQVDAVNRPRAGGQTVLYTSLWGASTPARGGDAVELVIEGVNLPLQVDKDMRGTLARIRAGGGTIPRGGVVLSGDDSATGFAPGGWQVGDEVTFAFRWSAPHDGRNDLGAARLMVGTKGHFLRGGVVDPSTWEYFHAPGLTEARHARSIIAWNDTHAFLVAVDQGLVAGAPGMTYHEAGVFLRDTVGATDAVMLDGGRSTTLVFDGAVANRPRFGERRVANALLLVRRPAKTE